MKLPLLSYLAIGSQCVTIVFGILHYRTLDAGLKTLLYFFVADFSLTLVSILMAMAKTNNLWIIQLDSLLRFSVFIAAYALWQERKIVRSLLIAMIVAYAAFWGWYSFFNHTFGEYDTVTRTITKATLASVSVFFLYALSNRDERKMSDDFRFWVALGTLTYCSGTLFLSSFGGSVLKSFEMYSLVWPINWVLFAIANGFYSKAMVCSSRR